MPRISPVYTATQVKIRPGYQHMRSPPFQLHVELPVKITVPKVPKPFERPRQAFVWRRDLPDTENVIFLTEISGHFSGVVCEGAGASLQMVRSEPARIVSMRLLGARSASTSSGQLRVMTHPLDARVFSRRQRFSEDHTYDTHALWHPAVDRGVATSYAPLTGNVLPSMPILTLTCALQAVSSGLSTGSSRMNTSWEDLGQ